jgi:hypothetical protein
MSNPTTTQPPNLATIQVEEKHRDAVLQAYKLIKEIQGSELQTYIKMLFFFDEMKETFLLTDPQGEDFATSMLFLRYLMELPFYEVPTKNN